MDLLSLYRKASECTLCRLHKTRKNVVFGEGLGTSPHVMFVGEAPGASEDKLGRPFVGPSGKKLDAWIWWMGLTREKCYILNTVKCRPPNNRNPKQDEWDACAPYFWKQLELIKPKVIVTLGKVAANAVLEEDLALKNLRDRWHAFPYGASNIAHLRCTYHPAYIARNPKAEAKVLEDLTAARVKLDEILENMRQSEGEAENR